MDNTEPLKRDINGPINILRLEGKNNNINKVIYLFMDCHLPLYEETKCNNIFAEDVHKYFIRSFYNIGNNNKITYDFFVEILPIELVIKRVERSEYKNIYIEEVVEFFKKVFKYDPKKNKVFINKLFKNFRFHYIDIRNYYESYAYKNIYYAKKIIYSFMSNRNIEPNKLKRVIKMLQNVKKHIKLVLKILSKKIGKKITYFKIIEKINNVNTINILEYLMNKMREKYKYVNVKRRMNKLLDRSIEKFNSMLYNIDIIIENFMNYVEYLEKSANKLIRNENIKYLYTYGIDVHDMYNMICYSVKKIEDLYDDFIDCFSTFMDVFFLRRFLDKDYITNAIVYTGALHINTYVYELVKYFNFKITHASYSKIKNILKLNEKIKKTSLLNLQELILPPELVQCSNMDEFPGNFL